MTRFMLKPFATIRSALKIWWRPEKVSRTDIVWFVILNTALLWFVGFGLAAVEAKLIGASLAHTFSLHTLMIVPLAAGMLYRGAVELQEIVNLKTELELASASLEARNAQLEDAHASLEQQANADFLTGLGNRRSFQINLYNRHNTARINGAPFWLTIIDLDNFKPVNDLHGHDAGDLVLKTVARRLHHQFGQAKGAHISRLGGDEFAIFFDTSSAANIVEAQKLVLSVCEDLARPVAYRDTELIVNASAGLVEWNVHLSPTEAMSAADMALMEAKREGKATVRVAPRPNLSDKAVA